jgi:hypothetical protein
MMHMMQIQNDAKRISCKQTLWNHIAANTAMLALRLTPAMQCTCTRTQDGHVTE